VIEAIGGAGGVGGGTSVRGSEGHGAVVTAAFEVMPGETLWVSAGGAGTWDDDRRGGRNGGGDGGQQGTGQYLHGSGGGGASDVRRGGQGLDDRILVAGGGGGPAQLYDYGPVRTFPGGDGGFPAGEDGNAATVDGDGQPYRPETVARGGAQAADPGTGAYAPGAFGTGATSDSTGGGGGGWYGGGAGLGLRTDQAGSSGGGGSSHVDASGTDVVHAVAAAPGDGRVTITHVACRPAETTTTTTTTDLTTTTTTPATTSSTVEPGPPATTTSTTAPAPITTEPSTTLPTAVPITTTPGDANVVAAIAADPSVARLGQPVELTVTVTNAADVVAHGATATVRLGDGLTFVAAAETEAFVPQTGVWQLGALAPGERATLTIDAVATRAGVVVSTVTAQADNDGDPRDNEARSEVRVSTSELPITGGTVPVWFGAVVVGVGTALVLATRRAR
jgi:uncharacterized repeat protein (TIGR01451 family)